ncbi:MAG: hypothetical protein LRZ85_08160 [Alphaproteobacteria bacterium]|nr:hypothetical protein [Alphaproteobacteria bacterium]
MPPADEKLLERGVPPLIGGPEFIPPRPRYHDHNGREVPPLPFHEEQALSPFSLPPTFLLPEALRPIFAGAAITNFNAAKFSADGSKVESFGVFIKVSDLDCNEAKKRLENHLKTAPFFAGNIDAREGVEHLAREFFLKGTLQYMSLDMKRGELPPEARDLGEEEKAMLLEAQNMLWRPDWPDHVQVDVTFQCRADTFGQDM